MDVWLRFTRSESCRQTFLPFSNHPALHPTRYAHVPPIRVPLHNDTHRDIKMVAAVKRHKQHCDQMLSTVLSQPTRGSMTARFRTQSARCRLHPLACHNLLRILRGLSDYCRSTPPPGVPAKERAEADQADDDNEKRGERVPHVPEATAVDILHSEFEAHLHACVRRCRGRKSAFIVGLAAVCLCVRRPSG